MRQIQEKPVLCDSVRPCSVCLLAVVELDHEEAVDLLDLSHAAVIPFCPAIFRPGGAVPGDALPGVSA